MVNNKPNLDIEIQPAVGPIGQLLTQLNKVGAKLNDEYTICTDFERGIPIKATPWQEIRPQVEALGRRARFQQASDRRTFLADATEIDTPTLRAALAKGDPEHRNIMNYVITGATWTAQQLYDMGRATDNLCRLCGRPELDIRHGLWHCRPVLEKAKAAMIELRIDPQDFPRCLQVGIPPSMSAKQSTTFWGARRQDLHTDDESMLQLMGAPGKSKFQQAVAEGRDIVVEELCQEKEIQNAQQMNARQLFQCFKGEHVVCELTPPIPCDELAPNEINVYTDGSLHDPESNIYSLGGAGAWWPHRQVQADGPVSSAENDPADERHPDHLRYVEDLAEAEAEIAEVDQQQDGLRLITYMQGFGGSSTRMELAAAIIALGARLPVHIGTDSQSFMTKANNVHDMIRRGRPPRRPWDTQYDGDLWRIYHDHAKKKGVTALNITKVKGHATQRMIDDKTVLQRDKYGNDNADEAAEKGVQMHGDMIVQLGARYANRQKQYIALLHTVHQHIALVYKIRAALLEEVEDKERPREPFRGAQPQRQLPRPEDPRHKKRRLQEQVRAQVPPAAPDPPEGLCNLQLTFTLGIQHCGDLCRRHPWAAQLQAFLGRMVFRKIDNGMFGCTWLELYICYKLAGYNMEQPQGNAAATANVQPTLGQQLKTFRLAVRRFASRTLKEEDKKFFRGGDRPAPRLRTCGIDTLLAVLPFQLQLQQGVGQELAVQVRRSQCKITAKEAKEAYQTHKLIPLRRIQTRGRANWHHTIRVWNNGNIFVGEASGSSPSFTSTSTSTPSPATSASTTLMKRKADGGSDPKLPEAILLQCPRCPLVTSGTREAFRHSNLDGKTWCKECRRSSPVQHWRCLCGAPWHRCELHKDEPDRLRAIEQPARKRNRHTPSPREVDVTPSAWIDRVSHRSKRARTDVIDLGQHIVAAINPRFLSPGLKNRFPHLVTQNQGAA